MNCPSCGRESAPGAKFCGNCGTPLPVEQNYQASGQQYAQAQPQYGPPTQYGPQPYAQQPYGQQPYGQPMYQMAQMKNASLRSSHS